MNRRQLLKTGLLGALAVVAAPVVKIAQVIPLPQWTSWSPWSSWSKWNYCVMRHRSGIADPNQMELEVILRPVIHVLDVNVVIEEDGVKFMGKATPPDVVT